MIEKREMKIAIKDIKAQLEKLEKVMEQEVDYEVLLTNFVTVAQAADDLNLLYSNYKNILLRSKVGVEVTRKQYERRYAAYYFKTIRGYTFKDIGVILNVTGTRAAELYRSSVRIQKNAPSKFSSKLEEVVLKCKDKTVEDLIKEKTFFLNTPKPKESNPYKQLLQDIHYNVRMEDKHIKLLRECYILKSNGCTATEVSTHFKIIGTEFKKLYEYSKRLIYRY